MKIRPVSFRDVTRLFSRHFWQRFADRFSVRLARSERKKKLLTVYGGLEQYTRKKEPKIRQVKDSCPSPTKMLKDLSKWKPTKTLKERAQRRSIDEVVFAKWKRNKTIPRHTAARMRCLPQQISILPVRKKSGDECEPKTLRGIIASVERYLQNL